SPGSEDQIPPGSIYVMPDQKTIRVGILLLPKFSFAQLGLVTEPMFIANWLLGKQRFQWQLMALDSGQVSASNGLSVTVDTVPEDGLSFDIIVIIASFELKLFSDHSGLHDWLRRVSGTNTMLCGIEGGTETLAAAGLLHGCRASVHWDNLDGLRELSPEVEACLDLYVDDNRYLSCAGGTAVLDLMLQWMRSHLERNVFNQLRHHLIEPRARHGYDQQGVNATQVHERIHPLVQRAIELMRETVEEPLSISHVADRLDISTRQLERHFKRDTQMSPSQYYLHLRIARAHRLLQQTNLSISEVAAAAGFQSLAHFSRLYRQYYGCQPSKDRLQ